MGNGFQNRWNFGQLNKWDRAHLEVAETYAQLSTAKRRKVGCVIVKDNRIISIGYNGMPSGWDNTCEYKVSLPQKEIYGSDDMVDMAFRYTLKTKPEVLHAETNAIAKVAKSTESAEGAVLYTTCTPCLECSKLIYQSGIERVVYRERYRTEEGLTFLRNCGIGLEQL